MRVDAPGVEEGPQLLRRLSLDDGGDPRRIGALLAARVREYPREPVLDDDRPAGGLGQTVGQCEQIRWAASGFGFAAF